MKRARWPRGSRRRCDATRELERAPAIAASRPLARLEDVLAHAGGWRRRKHRTAHRRVGHRRSRGALHPQRLAPQPARSSPSLRGAPRPLLESELLATSAALHRRGGRQRAASSRPRRRAVLDEVGEMAPRSGQAAAGARGTRVHALGSTRLQRVTSRRRRDQPRPARRMRAASSARTSTDRPRRLRDRAAAAARSPRGHPRAGRLVLEEIGESSDARSRHLARGQGPLVAYCGRQRARTRNAIERAVILADGGFIRAETFRRRRRGTPPGRC